ncbi:MAG: sodium ion-translocating decarboxylase subunit beta [Victivallales bacterium]|nr:sodium ion-translocating decarboxylase subunit beta [Victivallales bacterium]
MVETVTVEQDQNVYPGRPLCVLDIHGLLVKNGDGKILGDTRRSKAHLTAGIAFKVLAVNETVKRGEDRWINTGDTLFTVCPVPVLHDSVQPGTNTEMEFSTMMRRLWESTGIYSFIQETSNHWSLGIGRFIMICVGLVLLFLAIVKGFEPLLLVPIGFGAIMSNIPLAEISGPDGILGILFKGVDLGIYPLLIFLGIGAMTDFAPLIANPITALMGAAAQLGIFGALFGAVLISQLCPFINFSLKDAASIGIIGGADGPTAIFLSSKLSPNLLGSIAVAAYSYMALVPIIQPPIIKALTSKKERLIRMTTAKKVTKVEKIIFPITITMLCCLLLPSAAPLISMLMLGNLMKECMCVDRLSETAQNALINIVTIFLGLSVGSKLSADKFLNFETLGILLLGLIAFSIGTAGGVLLGKLMSKLSGGKINPMIGAAGVSAVPMAARVVNKIGLQEDPQNFLLMHAMGPNVSGVIGSAVAAGVLLCALGN